MLFSNTYVVSANTNNFSRQSNFTFSANFSFGGGSTATSVTGTITSGTGSISSTGYNYGNGGTMHVKIPFQLQGDWSGSWYANELLGCTAVFDSLTASEGTIQNVGVYLPDGTLLLSGAGGSKTYYPYVSDIALLSNGYNWGLRANYILEFDYTHEAFTVNGTPRDYDFNVTFTMSNFKNTIWHASDAEIASNTTPVADTTTQQNTANTANNTAQSAQNTEQIKSDTGGILSKVTGLFDNFLYFINNIINWFQDLFLRLFIPEDDYFSNWFSRVNTLLADKLGVLYYPFDLIISFLTDLQNQSTQSGQIVFPEVALPMNGERHVIIARSVLNLGDYDVDFTSSDNSTLVGSTGYTSVIATIRTFSSFAIVLALIALFLKKLAHIVNGEES